MPKPKHLYRYWVVGHIEPHYTEAYDLKDLTKREGRKRGSRLNEICRVHDLGRCEQGDKQC